MVPTALTPKGVGFGLVQLRTRAGSEARHPTCAQGGPVPASPLSSLLGQGVFLGPPQICEAGCFSPPLVRKLGTGSFPRGPRTVPRAPALRARSAASGSSESLELCAGVRPFRVGFSEEGRQALL